MSGLNGMFLSHELGGGHDDPRFPSFFEVFMQDRIDQSLKPAARHVAVVLAERFPRLVFLLERFDEAFAVLSLFLERHYLNKNDALLAESLYGFRRARYPATAATTTAPSPDNGATGSGSGSGSSSSRKDGGGGAGGGGGSNGGAGMGMGMGMGALTPADRRRALALTVLAPYAKAKLDALYNKWSAALPPAPSGSARRRRGPRQQTQTGRRLGDGEEQQREGDDVEVEEQEELGIRLRRAFVAMYPLLHASYEGSYFVYQWAYLLGRTKYYSPLLHLAGQALRRVTREDLDLEPSGASANSALAPAGAAPAPSLGARVARSLKVALVLAVVAFKVTEWWMATPEMVGAVGGGTGRRIVPPVPDPPAPAPNGLALPKDSGLCPLCKQPRANPAISPSGIAYCYRCLLAHVREAGAFCPVTLQACTEEQVRRVYLS